MSLFKRTKTIDPQALTLDHLVTTGRIQSVLGKEAVNEGLLNIKQGVKIDGTQNGNIQVAGKGNGAIWISGTGTVRGEVKAPLIVAQGVVDGAIITPLLIIEGCARISGRIYADRVIYRNPERVSIQAEILPRKAAELVDSNLPSSLVPLGPTLVSPATATGTDC